MTQMSLQRREVIAVLRGVAGRFHTFVPMKKHMLEIFSKLGVETRTAASLRALEVLSSPAAKQS